MAPPVDVFDSAGTPPAWRRRWSALPPKGRRLVVVVLLVALAGAAAAGVQRRVSEQRLAGRVVLAAAIEVATSDVSPVGGAVRWSVAVRNDGPRPVAVTSLRAAGGGLVLHSVSSDEQLPPGRAVSVPVSVRLTCGTGSAPGSRIVGEIGVRRDDGARRTRRIELATGPLRDVATTVCTVRPDTRDLELSGPVARPRSLR